ncbi:MAG: YgiT-type zinc finger protein [Chloroflexi bacterium]|nr:MAG: YgiT-type zinc finger protein [Chloroflexota bacterium]
MTNCEQCRIGRYRSTCATYVQWHEGQIMVIPNAPAYHCDVCGHFFYDNGFLSKLNYLLDRFADPATDVTVFTQAPQNTKPTNWHHSRGGR